MNNITTFINNSGTQKPSNNIELNFNDSDVSSYILLEDSCVSDKELKI